MGEQEPKTEKKNICVGLLAHVDAGKTTWQQQKKLFAYKSAQTGNTAALSF